MPTASAIQEPMRTQLLDAAEEVFYARGIQAVSMDELRTAAGLPLKRTYGRDAAPSNRGRSWRAAGH